VSPVGLAEGDRPPPVPLRLVHQARALGHRVDRRREHRRDRPTQHGCRRRAGPRRGGSHLQLRPCRP
jgi:hypothetical protein